MLSLYNAFSLPPMIAFLPFVLILMVVNKDMVISALFQRQRCGLGVWKIAIELLFPCSFEHSAQFFDFTALDEEQFAHVLCFALK